jgi:hypothetical protein
MHGLYEQKHCLKFKGKLMEDLAVVPEFVQTVLGLDPSSLHDTLTSSIDTYEDDETIRRGELRRVQGSHPALRYRGNPIWRSKIWVQTDFDEGLRRYYYTGWSWAIADATSPFDASPELSDLLQKINHLLPAKQQCNHG